MKMFSVYATAMVLALVLPTASYAQDYPSKPIKIIVPVAPGGITDIVARVFGEYVTRRTGQPVIVENRTGGAATIGTNAIARSAPDGYTLGLNSTSQIILNPLFQQNNSLDPLVDLVPVAPIAKAPELLVINAKLPTKTLNRSLKNLPRPG